MKISFSRLGVVASLILPILLAACVPSLHPIYTPETIVFREDLLGLWKEEPQDEESWQFTKSGEKSYAIVIQEKEGKSEFEGHLVKLGDSYFLDLFPSGEALNKLEPGEFYKISLIPGHLILKVVFGESLEIFLMEPDGLKEVVTEDPKALTHAELQDGRHVITAPTDQLQKFLEKYADRASLWGEPGRMRKLVL